MVLQGNALPLLVYPAGNRIDSSRFGAAQRHEKSSVGGLSNALDEI